MFRKCRLKQLKPDNMKNDILPDYIFYCVCFNALKSFCHETNGTVTQGNANGIAKLLVN